MWWLKGTAEEQASRLIELRRRQLPQEIDSDCLYSTRECEPGCITLHRRSDPPGTLEHSSSQLVAVVMQESTLAGEVFANVV